MSTYLTVCICFSLSLSVSQLYLCAGLLCFMHHCYNFYCFLLSTLGLEEFYYLLEILTNRAFVWKANLGLCRLGFSTFHIINRVTSYPVVGHTHTILIMWPKPSDSLHVARCSIQTYRLIISRLSIIWLGVLE